MTLKHECMRSCGLFKRNFIMDTETLTVLQKGENFEIIVEHVQSGSAYGITLSKNAYEQLRQHFAVGQGEQLVICKKCGSSEMYQYTKAKDKCEDCGNIQEVYKKNNHDTKTSNKDS